MLMVFVALLAVVVVIVGRRGLVSAEKCDAET
jgi:hypothetical protein